MYSNAALLAGMCGVAIGACAAVAAGIDKQDFAQIERGRYLTVAGDCTACHTVPGSGREFAGGRNIETPFGLLIGPNITPDPQTGIGAWTDDEFVNALTKGTGRDGARLYPAMPYTYYTKLTREDALAIRAYLNTIAPVYNPVEPNQLPFPFDIRMSMLAWDRLFFTPGTFRPVPNKSAEWNRGAYLAEGLTHCGMCHTPKNALGGDDGANALRGYALQRWFTPDITNDPRRGVGSWSVEEIAAYLKTGHNSTSAATGLMAEMVNLSTSHLTDADLKAIAVYLKDQPGSGEADTQSRVKADEKIMKMGAAIYADECSSCHGADGKGGGGPVSVAQWNPGRATGRCNVAAACRVARRAQRRHGRRADRSSDAAIRLAPDRRSDRRRCELYSQRLGQFGAAGLRRRGRQSAARIRRAKRLSAEQKEGGVTKCRRAAVQLG
jgi:mono/diheme cytochrome c family protein